jgi:hypothetical protein
MFKWYQKAAVCLAYPPDVSGPCECIYAGAGTPEILNFGEKCTCGFRDAFCSSRWFTRGWTLQELIAPGNITFYSSFWKALGTKHSFTWLLTETTGIYEDILMNEPHYPLESRLNKVPAAAKMSWASKRSTTREEDIAYCLMGIFDVNMSLLYGEVEGKAFLRLQMEIFETTEDNSLFAWNGPLTPPSDFRTWSGLLAARPDTFAGCGNISSSSNMTPPAELRLSVTKRGVYFPSNLIHPIAVPGSPYDLNMVALDTCRLHSRNWGIPIFWLLKSGENEYVRAMLSSTADCAESDELWFGKFPLTCNLVPYISLAPF